MRPSRLLPFLIPLLLAPGALLGASAVDVLRKAQDSDKQTSYRGMKVATIRAGGGSTTATLKVVHLKPDKTRTEYFAPSALAGIIVIQDGSVLWKYYPKDEAWERLNACVRQSPEAIRHEAFENYEIRLVGTEEVAGRSAYVIHAVPKRRGEWARRLWVDREHYVIIGTQVETASGKVINSSRYTSVEINPRDISAQAFKVTGKIKEQPSADSVGFKVEKPTYLPSGYRLVGTSSLSLNGASCSHLQYSNGVSTISLFQRKASRKPAPSCKDGSLANLLSWVRDGMQFTLMGEVPLAELRKISESMN